MGSVAVTEEDRLRVITMLPSWFNPNPGFRFRWDNDEAVVIGWGGWRSFDVTGQFSFARKKSSSKELEVVAGSIGEIQFHPATLVISYRYKGEWHLNSIERIIAEDPDSIHELSSEDSTQKLRLPTREELGVCSAQEKP